MAKPSVWLIAGPTASGKSGLALALAEAVGAEVVNADALQVYRDLAVLTARPSLADLAHAPHHLYGVADGAEAWSVGRWLRAAETVLAEIAERGRPAIVVGGTGLYFRALTEGLSEIPDVPSGVRDNAERSLATEGEAGFRERLRILDPEAEARIVGGDRQRLVRAVSVALGTGRPLSRWQAEATDRPLAAWRGLVLEPPREALYARCDARLDAMARTGALEEVKALLARGLEPRLPVMKALGVPEFAAHLRGELRMDQALTAARQSTRRYAKRQTTWFRNQTPDWSRLATADPDAALKAFAVSP
jgi:tRNA dimethylallyltransferase